MARCPAPALTGARSVAAYCRRPTPPADRFGAQLPGPFRSGSITAVTPAGGSLASRAEAYSPCSQPLRLFSSTAVYQSSGQLSAVSRGAPASSLRRKPQSRTPTRGAPTKLAMPCVRRGRQGIPTPRRASPLKPRTWHSFLCQARASPMRSASVLLGEGYPLPFRLPGQLDVDGAHAAAAGVLFQVKAHGPPFLQTVKGS